MILNPWIFLSISLLAHAYSVLTINQQVESLLSWKQNWLGSSKSLQTWKSESQTPCYWLGVSCNSDEVIGIDLSYLELLGNLPSNFTSLISLTKLLLPGTNLSGYIPKQISNLPQLTHLDLSDNALTGQIPLQITTLTNLQFLNLNSNRLQGSIPISLGNLTALKCLLLYDNHLSGQIPTSLGSLKDLVTFRAGGNENLQGNVPFEIGNCTNLMMLGLAETSISGVLPISMGRLKKLQTLAIYTAMLSGSIPEQLGDCDSLQNIYLYENSITGSIPTSLGKLQGLMSLLLWQNNIVGTIPSELGNCKLLTMIDVSMNLLSGSIPETFGNWSSLQEIQFSANQISGQIPTVLGKCERVTRIGLDNNQITGTIPSEFGQLQNLTLLFLWQNKLHGNIPTSLSSCRNLEEIDLSQNYLTGTIPFGIFEIQSLSKFLILSNNLSGQIPPEIGNCTSLVRFRANNNKLTGEIPVEIGKLINLNFLDLGSNRLTGVIPKNISNCQNLTFLDLHSNFISGDLHLNFNSLVNLQLLDVSYNQIEGMLHPNIGSLNSLMKLVLAKNQLAGPIPVELGSCSKLQFLDLSCNDFSGEIPASLGNIPSFEIALNVSWNNLSGKIPAEFAGLDKLGVMDLSHNEFLGDLRYLARLQNLVALNISFNNFSGRVPVTFANLPVSLLSGNPSLCLSVDRCFDQNFVRPRHAIGTHLVVILLLSVACALVLCGLYIVLTAMCHKVSESCKRDLESDADVDIGLPWEVMLYQKIDLSIADVASTLASGEVIGKGRSGVVYRATTLSGLEIAIKRFRSVEKYSAAAFSSEIATLARIRHRNIVRLLGWGANSKTKLLFYDFVPNGTLGDYLHAGCPRLGGWDARFRIGLGVAEGLAYLHHDCVPAIVHRDVKAHNILLGEHFEPFLADFGLARLVEEQNGSLPPSPQLAGSYGYFAPEYGCMLKITEKCDVYSYGVVLLEIITGKKPVDPSFQDGQHVVQWVRDQLKAKIDPVEILDPTFHVRSDDSHIQEMIQALGISLLCTGNRAEDRPTMKDVVALLRGIQAEPVLGNEWEKPNSSVGKKRDTRGDTWLLQGSSNCSLYSSANY